MLVHLNHYSCTKHGNTETEIEDAFCPKTDGELTGSPLRFAVADGATEGVFSKQWAQLLVESFCEKKEHNIVFLIEQTLNDWVLWKTNYVRNRNESDNPIHWYEEHGLTIGAFSTLLGFELFDGDDSRFGFWQATAVGDTCLFQVRNEHLIAKFPINHSSCFGNNPWLISTNNLANTHLAETKHALKGDWQKKDIFFLMTDALSFWFMQMCENNRNPWGKLRDLPPENEEFKKWVDDLRFEKNIHNDDVTLLRIDIL